MKNRLHKTFYKLVLNFSFVLFFLATTNVIAQTTISSWTYDAVQGTINNPTPNIGTGTSSVVNLVTPTTATGLSSATGCGSANSGLGWQHPNFDPGSSNEVNGVRFNTGTTGYTNIIFSWDQRFSKTSPNTVRLQYTTNGSTWTNFIMTGSNTTICAGSINGNGCFETNTGDSFRRIRVDLSSIVAANNNANFGIRLLASQYQSTGQYRQSNTPATVATNTGTWRFDNVNFLGTPTTTGGVISGSTTICPSTSTNINVTITGGVSPYTVVYTDGSTNYTVNNYTSGSNIAVSPSATTTYTLVSVTDNTSATVSPTSGSAVVTINAGVSPSFIASAGATSCPGTNITYTTQAGMDNYAWTFLNGVSAAVLGTDYIITGGSTATETVTIQWLLASGTATFSATVTYSTCSGASATSATVISLPNVLFTTQPGTTACANTDVTYTTQAGQSNYIWTISGVLNTDYTITSGGGTGSNTLVVKWLTTATTKTVTVNYTNSNGCTVATATSSTATTIYSLPSTPTFTTAPGANICANSSLSYVTQAGRFNYVWTIPGILNTDYTLVSGGTSSSNTLTIIWLTSGSKTVTVNYSNQLTPNCGALVSATNTTNVNIAPVITVQNSTAAQTTCIGTPFTPISVTATGTNLTYQWWGNSTYSAASPPTGGAPTGIATASFTAPSATAGTKYYYVIVSNSGCTAVRSTNYTLAYTVNPLSVGSSVSGSTTVCSGINSTTLTLTAGYVGSITKWQSSPVSNFASGVIDIANTASTLTVTNITATTYYRAVVTSGVCSAANSLPATITVSPVSVGGTVSGAGSICSSTSSATLTLSGQTGTIVKWQSSTVSDFSASVTDIVNTTATLTASNLTTTTYYRVVVQSSPCSVAYSSIAQITFKTTTWNGSSWDYGTPDNTTKAVFASLYTSTGGGAGDLQACSLEVLSGAIVTVNAGDSFTILNEVKVDGAPLPAALIMEDSSNLIQVNNVTNTDYIYYRRNTMPVKKYDYTYWSSPVSNETLAAFSPNSIYFYTWNSATYGWSYVAPSNVMGVAKGYIIRTADIAPFNTATANIWNGEFFGIPNNGTITAPIVLSGANDMNLLGNPYPSAVDADSFLTYNRPSNGGVLGGTLFFWTHNTPITAYNYSYSDYASYNLTGGIGTMAPSNPCAGCNNSIPNGKIGAGQSFFIQAAGTGTATFTNAMRFGVNSQFYKSNMVANAVEKDRLWIDISNADGLYKQLLVGYIDGATNDYDMSFDGNSVDVGNAIMIYTILGDKKLGIQGRALPFDINDEIPIGYKSTVAGTFEIKLSNFDGLFANQDVFIEDTLLHVIYNLKSGNYSFATEVGTFDSRFKLIFNGTSTLSNPTINASSFIVYNNNNQITVNSGTLSMQEIVVYDIDGRILNKYNAQNTSEFRFYTPTKNQVLLLKITTSDNKIFYKKILI